MAKAKNGGDGLDAENQAQVSSTEPTETGNEATDAIEPAAETPVQAETPVENNPSVKEQTKANGPKRMKIKNPECAGMKIGSASGVVVFDQEGIAEVGADNYAHLLKIPGYEAVE